MRAIQELGLHGGIPLGMALWIAAVSVLSVTEADWPSWRGNGNGSSHSGVEMVDSLDQARQVWRSDPIGLSGCMYPGGNPGTGWCDPVISEGRVFVSWFRRAGPDLVGLHCLAASRGWASLIDPPDNPEAFARPGGYRTSLPSKEMSALQRHVRADDTIDCLDDRTGKTLWRRVFPGRGINHVRLYSPLCVPCVKDGVLYALGSAGRVYALDVATGRTIWESDLGRRHAELDQAAEVFAASRCRANPVEGPLNTSVVCADGVVAMGEGEAIAGGKGLVGMVGFDAATGRRLWTVSNCLDAIGSPAMWRYEGREYLLAANGRMALIEPRTGKELWSVGGPENPVSDGCAAALLGDYVVVNKNILKIVGKRPAAWMRGPSCWRISLTGAELVWSLPIGVCGDICLIAPAIYGDHAYVPVKEGMACAQLATGKIVGKAVPGFSSAYAGYALGDGLIFSLNSAGGSSWFAVRSR